MKYHNHIRFIQTMGVGLALAFISKFVYDLPQDLNYHNFAYKRFFFQIPNLFDVFTNFILFYPCILGIRFTIEKWNDSKLFSCNFERWIRLIFFSSTLLAAFGSSCYHLNSNNKILICDGLLMVIGHMALLTMIISIYVEKSREQIKIIFILLQSTGIFSVLYFPYHNSFGIILYVLVQYLPTIIIPRIVVSYYKNNRTKTKVIYILLAMFFYFITKKLEFSDYFIFDILGSTINVHSLRHIFSAIEVFYIHKFCSTTKHIKDFEVLISKLQKLTEELKGKNKD